MVASTSIPTPAGEPTAPFRPDPDQAALLFDALASPTLSLQQVATQFSTTVEALSIFITGPRGSEALANLDSALFTRLHLIALSALPSVAASLAAIVHEHARFEATKPAEDFARIAARSSSSAPNPNSNSSTDPLARFKLLERKRINARKAGSLLYRLATLRPRGPRPEHPASTPLDPSTTIHTHRAANPPAPSPAAHASSPNTHQASPDAPNVLNTIDPLDPIDRFSVPAVLRARTPRAAERIAQATHNPCAIQSSHHDHLNPRDDGQASLVWPPPLVTTVASNPAFLPAPTRPLLRSGMTAARSLIEHAGSTVPLPALPSASSHSSPPSDQPRTSSGRATHETTPRGTIRHAAPRSDPAQSPLSPVPRTVAALMSGP